MPFKNRGVKHKGGAGESEQEDVFIHPSVWEQIRVCVDNTGCASDLCNLRLLCKDASECLPLTELYKIVTTIYENIRSITPETFELWFDKITTEITKMINGLNSDHMQAQKKRLIKDVTWSIFKHINPHIKNETFELHKAMHQEPKSHDESLKYENEQTLIDALKQKGQISDEKDTKLIGWKSAWVFENLWTYTSDATVRYKLVYSVNKILKDKGIKKDFTIKPKDIDNSFTFIEMFKFLQGLSLYERYVCSHAYNFGGYIGLGENRWGHLAFKHFLLIVPLLKVPIEVNPYDTDSESYNDKSQSHGGGGETIRHKGKLSAKQFMSILEHDLLVTRENIKYDARKKQLLKSKFNIDKINVLVVNDGEIIYKIDDHPVQRLRLDSKNKLCNSLRRLLRFD